MKHILSTLIALSFSTIAFAETPKVAQGSNAKSPAAEQSTKTPPTEPPVNQAPTTPVTTKSNDPNAEIKPETHDALEPLKDEANAQKDTAGKKKSKRKQK